MNGPTLKVIAEQANNPKNKALNLWVTEILPDLEAAAKLGEFEDTFDSATITGEDAAAVIAQLEAIIIRGLFSFEKEAGVYTISWA